MDENIVPSHSSCFSRILSGLLSLTAMVMAARRDKARGRCGDFRSIPGGRQTVINWIYCISYSKDCVYIYIHINMSDLIDCLIA